MLGIWKGKAVSWCAFAPREVFRRLENSRVHKRINDEITGLVHTLLFYWKGIRKTGPFGQILEGIIDFARKNNIGIIRV